MSKTEAINQNTINLDQLKTEDFVDLYIEEDKAVWQALQQAKKDIAKAIDLISASLSQGSAFLKTYSSQESSPYEGPRLFYMGAGTSGRLGILDASECPPTFSAHPEMIQGVVAGGDAAIRRAVEGAEDDEAAGYKFVAENLREGDSLIGISASGGAPYVIGALKAAQKQGLLGIAIANNPEAVIFKNADHKIFLDTGAEILSGSTRLKAGTSQKIVLNMISTGVMVKLGKTYQNLMVDVQATNIKLVKRSTQLVMKISACDESQAKKALELSNYQVKHAVLNILKGLDYQAADDLLTEKRGVLKNCL